MQCSQHIWLHSPCDNEADAEEETEEQDGEESKSTLGARIGVNIKVDVEKKKHDKLAIIAIFIRWSWRRSCRARGRVVPCQHVIEL